MLTCVIIQGAKIRKIGLSAVLKGHFFYKKDKKGLKGQTL